jgi:hypothetical protein
MFPFSKISESSSLPSVTYMFISVTELTPCLLAGSGHRRLQRSSSTSIFVHLFKLGQNHCNTLTRSYRGFRFPDRMAPEQTVRGGEQFLSLTHAGILHSFMPEDIFGILEYLSCEKRRSLSWEGITSLGVLILSYTPRPRLPCMEQQNTKYLALLRHFRHGGMEDISGVFRKFFL